MRCAACPRARCHAGCGRDAFRSDIGSTTKLVTEPAVVIAKAHHGSVSKEKRLQVERELKAGELPCVVATSSLELGIDMGSIDLVLQVAAPPSVASGLQRIGRANHQVGGRSTGSIYPRTRTEVIDAAVVAEGMRAGASRPAMPWSSAYRPATLAISWPLLRQAHGSARRQTRRGQRQEQRAR